MKARPLVQKITPYLIVGLCILVSAMLGGEAITHLIQRIWEEPIQTILSQIEG